MRAARSHGGTMEGRTTTYDYYQVSKVNEIKDAYNSSTGFLDITCMQNLKKHTMKKHEEAFYKETIKLVPTRGRDVTQTCLASSWKP